jgi:hypothetical protein
MVGHPEQLHTIMGPGVWINKWQPDKRAKEVFN